MPSKRDVLAPLTRDELLAVVDRFELAPPDRRAKDGLLDTVDARIRREKDCLAALSSAKESLMSVLLTGEVRVTPDEDPA